METLSTKLIHRVSIENYSTSLCVARLNEALASGCSISFCVHGINLFLLQYVDKEKVVPVPN
jgi:hypothetical protein